MKHVWIAVLLLSSGAAQAQTVTAATLTPAFKARLVAADANKDGRLTQAELRAMFREGTGILYSYDKNNDGALADAEIDTAAAMETALAAGQCDKNGDGALTGAEQACYKSK